MTQAVFQTEIKGNPYLDLGGEAGSNVRNHEVLALTDPEAPTGYYALNVYFGEHEVGEKDVPLISDTEIVFCPNYSRRFPGAQGDVALVWMWEKHAILEILRRDMRTVGMKPSEFVRQLDETGLPSDELEAKIQAAKKTSTVKGK